MSGAEAAPRFSRLRYLKAYPGLRRRLGAARRAWQAMSVEEREVAARRGITGSFNPHDGVVGNLPTITKPTLFPGMPAYGDHPTGHAIAYLRWVLYSTSGYSVRPAVNWGPWSYSATCQQGVYNTLAFFGLTASHFCSEANGAWGLVDFLYDWNF